MGSGGEPRPHALEIFEPAERPERGQGRRARAPAGDDATDRGIVDHLDPAHDLGRIERGAVDQQMLRQLLAARRGAFERHQQAGLHLGFGAGELGGAQPVFELSCLRA